MYQKKKVKSEIFKHCDCACVQIFNEMLSRTKGLVKTTKNTTFSLFLGTRFREGLDFGFVYLDIMHVYPEDAGTYTLKATNVLGQAVNSADLNVRSKETIVKETMHAAAVEQIAHLEQSSVSQVSHEEGFTTQAPAFTSTMRDVQLMEGTPAHFEAKLVPIGDPKLRVDWLKNGKPIQASNR